MSGNVPLEQCFKEAEETGRLNLSCKNLRDFPDPADDYELIDVIEADLSRNRLSELPVELCDFIMIEKINVYWNSIRGVPEVPLSELKYLRSLNLRRNQIGSFPIALCSLPLQVLNLSNNRLTSLPVEIGHLTLLQDLDLSSNKVSHLPNSMGEMISLKDLNIRRNRIEVLPDELSKLKLARLDFSHNKVSVIPPAYRLITTLSVLELAHNPLTSPPAQVCTKGRLHIFKYLSVTAQQQEKRRTFDREVIRTSLTRMGSNNSVKDDSSENNFFVDRVRRTHSLDSTRSSFPRETYEKEVYRPSSLRDRERTRPPLSNVFETEEKRQKVQKEIEKAQKLILADALVGADGEIPMKPNDDFSEGEELEKEFLQIEAEQRKKKEEEERQIEERRNAARKIQSQHEELQLQRQAEIRKKREGINGLSDHRKPRGSLSFGEKESPRPIAPERPSYKVLTRGGAPKPPSSPEPESPDVAWSRQEEELRARKREVLMQQSRREARLSRSRFEEQRLKGRQSKKNSNTATLSREGSGKNTATLSREGSGKQRVSGTGGAAVVFEGSEPARQSVSDISTLEREAWEESVFPNIQVRQSAAQARSLPASFRDKANPNFTIKRMYDSAREEFEQLEQLRESIENRLKVTLPDDIPAALANGVVLCHLINHIKKGMIPSIHIPSAGVPKLTMPKCQKNVDSFLEACRKLGVDKERLCSPSDILEEKSPIRVCQTVEILLEHTDGGG